MKIKKYTPRPIREWLAAPSRNGAVCTAHYAIDASVEGDASWEFSVTLSDGRRVMTFSEYDFQSMDTVKGRRKSMAKLRLFKKKVRRFSADLNQSIERLEAHLLKEFPTP